MSQSASAPLLIRQVTADDLPAVGEIYNHYILHSTCTFAKKPEPPAYWETWLSKHNQRYPAVVAIREDRLVGWGSLSMWNPRCAYRYTAEDSIYVHPECYRQGTGQALLQDLINRAQAIGHRAIIAQIADHQLASEALHRRLGFRPIGCLEEVGYKFGRWIDVNIWQLRL